MTVQFQFKAQGPVLQEYADSTERVTFIMGPLGSGKTFQSCFKIFNSMCSMPANDQGVRKSRWVAIRNTYPDLLGTTIKDWQEIFDNCGLGKFNNSYPPTHYLDFVLEDGTEVQSELVFMALDRDDSVRKLRGLQATGFWLNEVKELQKAVVDMCDLRHGRYPSKADHGSFWHGMIGDTNAPDDDEWYYKLAEEDRPEGWKFLRQPGGVIKNAQGKWVANPKAENLANLPDGYYTRGMAGKEDDWINVNLANNYGSVKAGLPIYQDQFNVNVHVSEEILAPMKGVDLILGFDFGLTPACIIGQITPIGQLRILDEIVAERMGIEGFIRDAVIPMLKSSRYKGFKIGSMTILGDPAGESSSDTDEKSCFEIAAENGLDIEAPDDRSNNPTARWEAVRYFLTRMVGAGKPAFLLSRHCTILRKGFVSGYAFKKMKLAGEAKYHERADKNKFSHPHDALQYLCLGAKPEDTSHNAPTTERFKAGDGMTGY